MSNTRNVGALIAGSVLIVFGLLALLSTLFSGFNFWNYLWPLMIIAFGGLFFVGMFAGGKSVAGLAIPGSILAGIGVMMFLQNIFNHWESWAYGWTVILVSVGVGIFIMGLYTGDEHRKRSGLKVMQVGAILFIIFGGFFEMIFSAFRLNGLAQYLFPALLILLGLWLVISRAGLFSRKQESLSGQAFQSPDENKL